MDTTLADVAQSYDSRVSLQDTQNPTYEGQTLQEQIARAKREMATMGITTEQKAAYKPLVSQLVLRGITPFSMPYHSNMKMAAEEQLKELLPTGFSDLCVRRVFMRLSRPPLVKVL
jgi:hypothetical protein